VVKGEQLQVDTMILKTDRLCHDYAVLAKIKTDKYTYESDVFIIRSQKNNFDVDVYPNEKYNDWENNVATIVNKGDTFSITVDYENEFVPNSVEVKLNGTIPVEHSLNFEHYSYGDHIITSGGVTIPEDLDEGVYQVFVYLDGHEFKTNSDIEITRGKWETLDPEYNGDHRGEYVSFVKGDDLYLIGGEFYVTQLIESPVWKYNIPANSWERKGNFPHTGDMRLKKIFPINLEYNNEAYIILRTSDALEIWKYIDEMDEWVYESTYPGLEIYYLTSFICEGELFIGGDTHEETPPKKGIYDFWVYDLETKEWKQKNKHPIIGYGYNGNLCITTKNKEVFVFSYSNELWQYFPETDTWVQKMKFPGPNRIDSNLIEKDNKLYLIAGEYTNYGLYGLKDCWEYDIDSNEWEMIAFLPELCAHGISFIYNNTIYTGLGWVVNGYTTFDEQNFYLLEI